jgi:hypothetical protein
LSFFGIQKSEFRRLEWSMRTQLSTYFTTHIQTLICEPPNLWYLLFK